VVQAGFLQGTGFSPYINPASSAGLEPLRDDFHGICTFTTGN
jgi:hypothetical protein